VCFIIACDLLEKLLDFNPDTRITAVQALAHPYLQELHLEAEEPVCTTLDPAEFNFELKKLNREDLKVLVHKEIVTNYPRDEYSQTLSSPLNSFHQEMKNALPSPMKRGKRNSRRKSF